MQIALNSSLVTCFKCCGLGSHGPVTCLQAHQGCLLAGNAEGQLVRFAQQPNSSIWVEDKRVCVTGRVTSLDAAEDASQAVVGTSMGTIWYGQVSHASCLLVPTSVCESAVLFWHSSQCAESYSVLSNVSQINSMSSNTRHQHARWGLVLCLT